MDEEAIFKVVQWEIFLNLHFCNVSNGNEVILLLVILDDVVSQGDECWG